jgi:ribonuclease HII
MGIVGLVLNGRAELQAGVDEVGRGPLAGSVVAAAVILPDNYEGLLCDSKQLSHNARVKLAAEIKSQAVSWALGEASVQEIDTINILQASLLAMKRAVMALKVQPDMVLVDGNKLPDWQYQARAIIKGDQIEPAISAASIIAKVARDEMLINLDAKYPEYGFAKHKGYGTKAHMLALEKYGPTVWHRKSFAPVAKYLQEAL